MSKICIFMADGVEEVEALSVVDLVRRAGITIDMVSIMGKKSIDGSHGIVIEADKLIEDISFDDYDGLVCPGGLKGTNNLKADDRVAELIRKFFNEKKLVSAICAAPTVLGAAGVLEGKNATCYPGCEDGLTGANKLTDKVVKDGNLITSRGMGTAIDFGLAIVEYFTDEAIANDLAKKIVFK